MLNALLFRGCSEFHILHILPISKERQNRKSRFHELKSLFAYFRRSSLPFCWLALLNTDLKSARVVLNFTTGPPPPPPPPSSSSSSSSSPPPKDVQSRWRHRASAKKHSVLTRRHIVASNNNQNLEHLTK